MNNMKVKIIVEHKLESCTFRGKVVAGSGSLAVRSPLLMYFTCAVSEATAKDTKPVSTSVAPLINNFLEGFMISSSVVSRFLLDPPTAANKVISEVSGLNY